MIAYAKENIFHPYNNFTAVDSDNCDYAANYTVTIKFTASAPIRHYSISLGGGAVSVGYQFGSGTNYSQIIENPTNKTIFVELNETFNVKKI